MIRHTFYIKAKAESLPADDPLTCLFSVHGRFIAEPWWLTNIILTTVLYVMFIGLPRKERKDQLERVPPLPPHRLATRPPPPSRPLSQLPPAPRATTPSRRTSSRSSREIPSSSRPSLTSVLPLRTLARLPARPLLTTPPSTPRSTLMPTRPSLMPSVPPRRLETSTLTLRPRSPLLSEPEGK